MQSQIESEHSTLRTNLITIDRPDSSQLVDLHVYIIPKSIWKEHKNLAENDAIEQAISAGFVRVSQNLTIHDLRQHILDVCGQENEFPKEFIYLRSVGRCLAKVKPQQETDLRVKNYRPPITIAPEIFVVEGHYDDDSSMSSKSKSFLARESPIEHSSDTPPHITTSRQQSLMESIAESPAPPIATENNSFGERQNSTILNRSAHSSLSTFSRASSTLSARDLSKLREEQERLRLRQIELARQRRQIEEEQKRRALNNDKGSSESENEEPTRDIKPEKQNHKTEPEKPKHEEKKPEIKHEEKKPEIKHEEKKPEIKREEPKHQIEKDDQKHEKELHTKPKNLSQAQREKEEKAAVKIQAGYRGYRTRRKIKEQKEREISNFVKYRGFWSPELEHERIRSSNKQRNLYSISFERYQPWRNEHLWSASSSLKNENIFTKKSDINQPFGFSSFRLDAHAIERLLKEARELARRKAEDEHAEEIEAYDVLKLSKRLEEIKAKRIELETNREVIIRRMQQIHAQITVRRTEERDLWKQKYLAEKRKTIELEEKTQMASKDQPDMNSKIEQAKIRLNHTTKLRQQAETECHLLRQELQQIRSSMNPLEKHPILKQLPSSQQQKIPITFDNKSQY
ncbi:unnamed protein product [Adineta steineri]|uniref:Spermatogenesis-associated protein 1 C-terminal domain-containing protein n=1 Tax=Adineta steineri TaxID=433720 RepID=A0A813PFS0_9BILA|nr:unnamed protein product [Adineta steineri]